MKFADDEKSALKNRLMRSDGSIENGMDLVRVFKMASKLFKKNREETANEVDFSDVVSKEIDHYFFINTLHLKSEEVNLFLEYCENDPKSKNLLKQEDEFLLLDFLIEKSEEFKRITTFEK